jgi:hypothetical protein
MHSYKDVRVREVDLAKARILRVLDDASNATARPFIMLSHHTNHRKAHPHILEQDDHGDGGMRALRCILDDIFRNLRL